MHRGTAPKPVNSSEERVALSIFDIISESTIQARVMRMVVSSHPGQGAESRIH